MTIDTRTVSYVLTYDILADSRLEAITKAGGMLRVNVKVRELVECEQALPGWWSVVMYVEEDLSPMDLLA